MKTNHERDEHGKNDDPTRLAIQRCMKGGVKTVNIVGTTVGNARRM